jgi:hypothetical protein
MKTPSNDWNQSAGKDDPDEDRKRPAKVRPPPPRPTIDNVSGSTKSSEEATTNAIDDAFRRVRNRSRNEQVGGVPIELVDDDDGNNTDGVDSNPVSSGSNSLASSTACMSSPQQCSSGNGTTTTAGDDPIQNNVFTYPYVAWWGRTTTTASPLVRSTSSTRGTPSTTAKEENLYPTIQQFQPKITSKQPTGGSKVVPDTVVDSRTTSTRTTTTEALAVADVSTNSSASTIVRLQRNIRFYAVSTVIAWIVFLCHILPTAALWALLWIVVSTGLMCQSLHTSIQQWLYNLVVVGPGLGSYVLPESIYILLTQTSLHEFMTDETVVLEYRHLLLYLLPLTNSQLHAMLHRLAPQHQQRLHRRGEIGHMICGEAIMHVLLGNVQYEQWRQSSQSGPSLDNGSNAAALDSSIETTVIPTPSPAIQERQHHQTLLLLSDDEGSDLGLDVSSDDLIGGDSALVERLGLTLSLQSSPVLQVPPLVNNQTNSISFATDSMVHSGPPNEVVTTRNNESSRNNRESSEYVNESDDNEREYQVLVDALWESVYETFWNPMNDYIVSSYMVPAMRTLTRMSLRTGILLLSISTGNLFGLWGWSYNILYNTLQSARTRQILSPSSQLTTPQVSTSSTVAPWTWERSVFTQSIWFNPSTTTWSTAILGGASMGISYYARQYVRRHAPSLNAGGRSTDVAGSSNNHNTTHASKSIGTAPDTFLSTKNK